MRLGRSLATWVVIAGRRSLVAVARLFAAERGRIVSQLSARSNARIRGSTSSCPRTPAWSKLAEGFDWSEGPVWVKDGGYLLFSDIPRNSVMKWKEGEGISLFMKPLGLHRRGRLQPRAGQQRAERRSARTGRVLRARRSPRLAIGEKRRQANAGRQLSRASGSTAPTTACSNPTAICTSPIRRTDCRRILTIRGASSISAACIV